MTDHFINSAESVLPKITTAEKEVPVSNWQIRHIAAAVGLLGGTFALFCAIFLTFFQYFYGAQPHDVWLYAVVLPLWVFGAHCLDRADEIDKAGRIEYCKKHALTGDECGGTQKTPNESFC